jgi:hypothetical protein
MRVILAVHLSLGVPASSRIADDSDISACQTDNGVDILDNNPKPSEDSSSSRVAGGGEAVAANFTGGSGRVVALAERHGDTGDGDEVLCKRDEFPKNLCGRRETYCESYPGSLPEFGSCR